MSSTEAAYLVTLSTNIQIKMEMFYFLIWEIVLTFMILQKK